MARMIPSNPDDFNNSYGEMQVFEALKSGLSNDYTVFHSLRWNRRASNNRMEWGESDFTVFHARHGLLVVEVKSGGILLEGGSWFYERTDNQMRYPMKDPLEQANRTKYHLKEIMDDVLPSDQYCWIEPIVWFPSLSDRGAIRNMPNTYHDETVLMGWALENPKEAIENAYRFYDSTRRTSLSGESARQIVMALAPAFRAVPSLSAIHAEQEHMFLRLTSEQNSLLDYLEEQRTASIQGSAGTGKTLLAVEKASRLSDDCRVLFLCHNRFLMEHLRRENQNPNINFSTLHALVNSQTGAYGLRSDEEITAFLNNYDTAGSWNYRHIIIDEGQDFLDEHLELLSVIADCVGGAFYVFYDKNQLVHRHAVPDSLLNAECRLVLRRNCRNTRSIAVTATRPLHIEPFFWEKLLEGKMPAFYISPDQKMLTAALAKRIAQYVGEGIQTQQITILTVKTEETSRLNGLDNIGRWPLNRTRGANGILFTSARKFKGLESDVIMIVDVDADTFARFDTRNLFYVAASRAKHFLDIFAVANDQGLTALSEALAEKEVKSGHIRKIMSSLKTRLGE